MGNLWKIDKVYEHFKGDVSQGLYYNGQVITPLKQGIKKVYKNQKFVNDLGMLLCDFWWDIDFQNTQNEGGVSFPTAKKPELLLSRIIELTTEENDIVLDYHLGSGTTNAVSLKSNRQFIGIEQMDYGDDDSVKRLNNVIKGEQSGVSKAYNWKGEGSFLYLVLAKNNQSAKEFLLCCKSFEELMTYFDELYNKYFLHYNVRIKEFKEVICKEDNFKNLSLSQQQEIFCRMLDNNQLYVNVSEMEDARYNINKEDIALTKDFYQIKEKAHQRRKDHKVQLEINMERLGSKILELHKLKKSYGDKVILDGFDYVFKRGERIGIIGKNGTGKSSFLNIITQNNPIDGGKVVVGETVKFGYYTQSGIAIKEGQKVIEVIKEFGEFIPLTKGRKISASQLLERFLFDKKKQYDFVEKLSGGEQKRLYLCAVLIQNPNFLILDEPTNDLDVITLNVLENFLLDYPGNLMVVSHDRYFMDKIVDALFVFRGDGIVENFPGNYSDFRAYENSNPYEQKEISNIKTEVKPTETKSQKVSLSYNEKREFGALEDEIQRLQNQKERIEKQFLNVEIAEENIAKKSEELKQTINNLEQKEERWLELSMKLES